MKTNLDTNSIFIKVIVVAVLIVVMLIPISLVKSLIEERAANQETVQTDFSEKWGGRQQVTGPILVLPYEETYLNEKNIPVKQLSYAYYLPDNLDVDGVVNTEERARSLYRALLYQSDIKFKGHFPKIDYTALGLLPEQIVWKDAHMLIGITDLQGVKNKIIFNINGVAMAVKPGVSGSRLIGSGVTVKMPLDANNLKDTYSFDFNLLLNGNSNLSVVPVAKENAMRLKSAWNTVSFSGNVLPSERNIDDNGFEAKWNAYDYDQIYTQMWTDDNAAFNQSTMGVDLRYSIDKYQMTMRSVKYAIMFIVLTFVAFFLIELISRKRIHPVQYLLVSFALILFYTLLLALSEHLNFMLSYIVSALAISALITVYSISIFKDKKLTALMGAFLIVIYVYLYIILQMENMSLLFGSVGLFIALAITMYVSRKVNWYKSDNDNNDLTSEQENKIARPTPPPFNADGFRDNVDN